eukprot:1478964-Prymnesium_polylepis.1
MEMDSDAEEIAAAAAGGEPLATIVREVVLEEGDSVDADAFETPPRVAERLTSGAMPPALPL